MPKLCIATPAASLKKFRPSNDLILLEKRIIDHDPYKEIPIELQSFVVSPGEHPITINYKSDSTKLLKKALKILETEDYPIVAEAFVFGVWVMNREKLPLDEENKLKPPLDKQTIRFLLDYFSWKTTMPNIVFHPPADGQFDREPGYILAHTPSGPLTGKPVPPTSWQPYKKTENGVHCFVPDVMTQDTIKEYAMPITAVLTALRERNEYMVGTTRHTTHWHQYKIFPVEMLKAFQSEHELNQMTAADAPPEILAMVNSLKERDKRNTSYTEEEALENDAYWDTRSPKEVIRTMLLQSYRSKVVDVMMDSGLRTKPLEDFIAIAEAVEKRNKRALRVKR